MAAKAGQKRMMAVARRLVEERRAAIRAEKANGSDQGSRDLLTLLLKVNMNPEIPESQRLSDEDVMARKLLLSSIDAHLADSDSLSM